MPFDSQSVKTAVILCITASSNVTARTADVHADVLKYAD